MDEDAPYDLAIAYESDSRLSDESIVRRSILAALTLHSAKRASVSIALVDDTRIASLNEEYLNHAGPTDVITFNLGTDHTSCQSKRDLEDVDGEIVISIETAARESNSRQHSLDEEVALYAVHGLLHLLGYDDQTHEDAQHMHTMEDDILASIGMGPIYRGQAL